MTSTYSFTIKDKNDANPYQFNVTRWDFNWSSNIKTYSTASGTSTTTRQTPTFFDFGRKIEGFVLYGWISKTPEGAGYDEVMSIRTLLNGSWWSGRPARLYMSTGAKHDGQVADFKVYDDRMAGADKNIKFTLTFVVAQQFSLSKP